MKEDPMVSDVILPDKDITDEYILGKKTLNIQPFTGWTKLYIHAEEIIIQSGKLQIKIPTFWNLENIEELTFIIKDKKYKFRRVPTK